MIFVLLVSCSTVCGAHLFSGWADHPDRRKCFCGNVEVVEKSTPPPMPITLQWKPSLPDELRKAEIREPDPIPSPRWEVEDE